MRNLIGSVLDMRLRPVATGIFSYLPGLFTAWDTRRKVGNTHRASYCRDIWRFHRDAAGSVPGFTPPKVVGELGPGASLGVCIAALLDGVEMAIARDAGPYASTADNQRIFDELVAETSATNDRAGLRRAIARAGIPGEETVLKYVAPWDVDDDALAGSLDLLFNHSVMEHVSDPVTTYAASYRWLKPGGIMSHRIDFSSHGITRSWNGHFDVPALLWKIVCGRRPFLLNRWNVGNHIAAMQAAGFEVLPQSRFIDDDGHGNQRELQSFEDPRSIRAGTILARKPS